MHENFRFVMQYRYVLRYSRNYIISKNTVPLIKILPLNANGDGKAHASSKGYNGEVNNSLPKIV